MVRNIVFVGNISQDCNTEMENDLSLDLLKSECLRTKILGVCIVFGFIEQY